MNSYALRPIALLIATISLAACATTSSCPPVPEYSQPFRQKLGDEISELEPGSALLRSMEDYYVLRKQLKACQ